MKKMVLVDPTQLYVKTTPVPDPMADSVFSLDGDIKQILDSSNTSVHDKALAYQQTLQKYIKRIDQFSQRQSQPDPQQRRLEAGPTQTEDSLLKIEKRIVDSLPATLQRKGSLLLSYLKEKDIGWNDRGELKIKDELIPGTNISDLVHETLRARKLDIAPKGWKLYADVLKESNIPKDLIGNKARWESSDIAEFIPPSPATPRRHKGKRKKQKGGGRSIVSRWLKY